MLPGMERACCPPCATAQVQSILALDLSAATRESCPERLGATCRHNPGRAQPELGPVGDEAHAFEAESRAGGQTLGSHCGLTVTPRTTQMATPAAGPNRPQVSSGQLSAVRFPVAA